MSQASAQTKPGTPLPGYLVVGDDALKRERIAAGIKRRLAQMGDMTFNTDTFEGGSAEGASIVNACRTVPFLSPYRLVCVTEADKLKKADSEELVAYLKSPNESTVLLLTGEKLAKGTRLYKAVAALGAKAVIECVVPKTRDLPNLVREMAPAHGATMTADAAHKLVELVGDDTVRLDAEVAKLALLHEGSQPIGVREVLDNVSQVSEPTRWDFVNAFSARNTAACVAMLGQMKSVSPHSLIGLCANRLRDLMAAQSMIRRGTPGATAQALGKQDWQVRSIVADARRFKAVELERGLLGARKTEMAMNSGKDADDAFLEWVISVTGPASR
uniref:DNA polymerase III subunit delta n=1 Tax=Muribaculaceae bacterium Z82 TaxID=2304548 RepID=A0A7C9JJY6_9BACT